MTICVIGGDHYDARMGVTMLAQRGIVASSVAVSESPADYMSRQHDHASLQAFVFDRIATVKADTYVVFCNTLSFSMDWDLLSRKLGAPVTTLAAVYREFLKSYKSIGVIAMHEHTLYNIRKFCDREHSELETICFSMMPLVVGAEQGATFINETLNDLIGVSARLEADAFVFGCTHFEDCIFDNPPIELVYPGELLLEYVIKNDLLMNDDQALMK
jgi:glutamate racemase